MQSIGVATIWLQSNANLKKTKTVAGRVADSPTTMAEPFELIGKELIHENS